MYVYIYIYTYIYLYSHIYIYTHIFMYITIYHIISKHFRRVLILSASFWNACSHFSALPLFCNASPPASSSARPLARHPRSRQSRRPWRRPVAEVARCHGAGAEKQHRYTTHTIGGFIWYKKTWESDFGLWFVSHIDLSIFAIWMNIDGKSSVDGFSDGTWINFDVAISMWVASIKILHRHNLL